MLKTLCPPFHKSAVTKTKSAVMLISKTFWRSLGARGMKCTKVSPHKWQNTTQKNLMKIDFWYTNLIRTIQCYHQRNDFSYSRLKKIKKSDKPQGLPILVCTFTRSMQYHSEVHSIFTASSTSHQRIARRVKIKCKWGGAWTDMENTPVQHLHCQQVCIDTMWHKQLIWRTSHFIRAKLFRAWIKIYPFFSPPLFFSLFLSFFVLHTGSMYQRSG